MGTRRDREILALYPYRSYIRRGGSMFTDFPSLINGWYYISSLGSSGPRQVFSMFNLDPSKNGELPISRR